ncbi:MAG: hypothetical protein JNL98_42725, partial [Bryobacterales bacterium]|nr:hypothetical protein [Bryobacterales bacterium]
MNRRTLLSLPMLASPLAAQNTKPKRINKAIELLAQGQPIYYTGARGGAGYDEGKKMAQTWADYINYEMEHGQLDFSALRNFMRGLIDGGPTKSGHRTPAVIATYVDSKPVAGLPEGMLGNGSQGSPAEIWGLTAAEYKKRADPWPLNPDGEFLLGLKVEDKYALANAEKVTSVPGIGFAEWGPGD